MLLRIGGWLELECANSYVYARVGRRQAMIKHNERGYTLHTGTYSGRAQRPTFRVTV